MNENKSEDEKFNANMQYISQRAQAFTNKITDEVFRKLIIQLCSVDLVTLQNGRTFFEPEFSHILSLLRRWVLLKVWRALKRLLTLMHLKRLNNKFEILINQ